MCISHPGLTECVVRKDTRYERWYQMGVFYLIPIMSCAKLISVSSVT